MTKKKSIEATTEAPVETKVEAEVNPGNELTKYFTQFISVLDNLDNVENAKDPKNITKLVMPLIAMTVLLTDEKTIIEDEIFTKLPNDQKKAVIGGFLASLANSFAGQ